MKAHVYRALVTKRITEMSFFVCFNADAEHFAHCSSCLLVLLHIVTYHHSNLFLNFVT